MILLTFGILAGCGDDGDGLNDADCQSSALAAATAINEFTNDNTSVTKCQAAITAIDAALMECEQFVNANDLQNWQDFLDLNPCDSL